MSDKTKVKYISDIEIDDSDVLVKKPFKLKKENKITVATSPDRLTDEEKSEAIERTEAAWSHPERDRQLATLIEGADQVIQESKGKDTKKLAEALQKLREALENTEEDMDDQEISRLEENVLDEMYELES